MQLYNRLYAPERGHPRAAPIVADQAGMPPTLLLTTGLDPLRDQGLAYVAKTIAAGVPTSYREAEGTIHGFAGFRGVIPSRQADFADALEVAKQMIGRSVAKRGGG